MRKTKHKWLCPAFIWLRFSLVHYDICLEERYGTWTTLLMTIVSLSQFHLGLSETESATANHHILYFSIQGMKTQKFPKSVLVSRGDVTFSYCFELAVPSMWTGDSVWSVGESTRFWIIVLLVKEQGHLEWVELPVSLQLLDLSLKRVINIGPFYRENSGEGIDKEL